MLALLCAVLLLPAALSDILTDFPSRDDFMRAALHGRLAYVPANDVELWYGWRKIYIGEGVFANMVHWRFFVKFQAPPDRLSTVVHMDVSDKWSSCFQWVRVNVPGSDLNRGEDLLPLDPAHFYESTVGFYGSRVVGVLVFPQSQRLDPYIANRSLSSLAKCSIDGFQAALRLDRADAITIYSRSHPHCGADQYVFRDEDRPNWRLLRQNLWKLPTHRFFSELPPGVLEVEYMEGVPLRMGNCLPLFLTFYPPRSLKFAATAGTYYTLCFVDLGNNRRSCDWLLVNVPEGDFSRGVEIVPYAAYPDDHDRFAECMYLLYSQGKKEVAVSEIGKLSRLTPNAISDRFSLGSPVAVNFYASYWYWGPIPERHPSVPSTGLPTKSPVQNLFSTPRVPPTPRAPPTRRVPSTVQVATTTQNALATSASTGSTLTPQDGLVCVAVTGLLVLLQVPIPAHGFPRDGATPK